MVARFQFDCVFYHVNDLEQATGFYSQVLGLKLVSRDVVARYDVDGVLFELVPNRNHLQLGAEGNARLCLRVNDMTEAVEYLKAKGVHVHEVEEMQNGKLASFRDPDGNEICIWQYT